MNMTRQVLAALMLCAGLLASHAASALEFSGKVTAIETRDDVTGLVIDGRSYEIAPNAVIKLREPDGSLMGGGAYLIQEGMYVNYSVSNESGKVGMIDALTLTGPRDKVQDVLNNLK